MENFVYRNPTTVYFGRKTEENVGKIVAQYSRNILLHHYGEDILKMIGIYDTVIKSLNEAGVKFTELGGVKPNPERELIFAAKRALILYWRLVVAALLIQPRPLPLEYRMTVMSGISLLTR